MIELSDSTWDESMRLLTSPRFLINDFDENGIKDLLVKQRVQNGTFYHAVISRFYEIDTSTLNLDYKFSVETISWLPMKGTYIKRILDKREVRVYLSQDKSTTGKLIGMYNIEFDKKGQPINTKIKVYDNDYEGVLITSSPRGVILPPLVLAFQKENN